MSVVRIDGTAASAETETSAYSLVALKKAAYRVADRCSVIFGAIDGSSIQLQFLCSDGTAEAEVRDCVRAFFDEALDQDLRERIAAETAPLRNLILAHAFSRTRLVSDGGER
jgi:His-Xaa-Ser system protein HxsD